MDNFWTKDDRKKEKELREICQQINEGKLHLSCKQIAERLGTTLDSVKAKKMRMNLITDPRVLNPTPKGVNDNNEGNIKKEMVPGIELNSEEEMVISWLKKQPLTIGDISRRLNEPKGVSKEYVYLLLDGLRKKGFDVAIKEDIKQAVLNRMPEWNEKPIKIESLYRNHIKLLVISDTHLTSIHQQLTLLHTAYELGEKEKVDVALNCGDLTDGFRHAHIPACDSFTKGLDELVDYTVKHYPHSEKFKTKFIGGRHDMSTKYAFGFDLLRAISEKRDDLSYVGDTMGTFRFKNTTIRLYHPTGGVPFSRSYRAQRITEAMIGSMIHNIRADSGARDLPQLMFFGHTHIAFFFPYMGSLVFSVPCLQSQTGYLEGKGLYPDIGCWIVDINFDDKGNVLEITPKLYLWNHLVRDHDY